MEKSAQQQQQSIQSKKNSDNLFQLKQMEKLLSDRK